MNLKKETLDDLAIHGKSIEDIKWIGTYSDEIPTEEFWKAADREYDDGYGLEEVNESLLVVGDGWWLERHSYDGSEWWEFKQLPSKPDRMTSKTGEFFVFEPVHRWEKREEEESE